MRSRQASFMAARDESRIRRRRRRRRQRRQSTRWLAAGAVAAALAACASISEPPQGVRSAIDRGQERRIDRLVGHGREADVAVAYFDLASGASLLRNERKRFHAASTMKVPVMFAAFEAVERGEMALDQPIPLRNEFHSLVDGSPFRLAAADDGDPDLYAALGGARPLSELIRRMIVRSSNLATNLLIERIGASRVSDLMRRLGAYEIQVLRGVEDEKAYKAGFNNTVTAYDLMLVLRAIAESARPAPTALAGHAADTAADHPPGGSGSGGDGGLLPGAAGASGEPGDPGSNLERVVSARSARAMLDILEAQEFNEKIPAGLPPGTVVAHKTGDIAGVHHDAAIVYPPGAAPYVLVVLTSGFADEKAANRLIAEISRAVWLGR
jgi:beta-lactamase class A